MTSRRIGSHVPARNAAEELTSRNGDVAQVFLSSPRSWRGPEPGRHRHLADVDGPVYAHAPYLVNPASANPDTRRKSREVTVATLQAADDAGIAGVVVHGGHATGEATAAQGLTWWRELLDAVADAGVRTPLLIENTAGGADAMARTLPQLAALWQVVEPHPAVTGFCLDTCHTFAGDDAFAEDPGRWMDGLQSVVGGVDLVHVNGSQAPAGSLRDRHANLEAADNVMPLELVAAQLEGSGDAPAVVETPGGVVAQGQDIAVARTLPPT